MKKIVLLAGILMVAFLGFAAVAAAQEASVFGNGVLIRAYVQCSSGCESVTPMYSAYLEVRNEGGAIFTNREDFRVTGVLETPTPVVTENPFKIHDNDLVTNEISMSYDNVTKTVYVFCTDAGEGLHVMKYDISLTAPVNGLCVTYGTGLTHAPSDLCEYGNPDDLHGDGPWYWTCKGLNRGNDIDCSAQLRVDGACGSLNHQTVLALPTSLTDFCSAGTRTALTTTSTGWTWTCSGDGGGNNATDCSATQQIANIDLIVSGVTGMVGGSSPGWPLAPSVTIKNTGGDTTGSFNVKVYWSSVYPFPTYIVPSSAALLGTQRVTGLSGGQSKTLRFNFTVPSGAILHNYYYVLYVVDADKEVGETNENNNIKIGSFFVQ